MKHFTRKNIGKKSVSSGTCKGFAVFYDYARAVLSSVLNTVQAAVNEPRGFIVSPNAEQAAFMAYACFIRHSIAPSQTSCKIFEGILIFVSLLISIRKVPSFVTVPIGRVFVITSKIPWFFGETLTIKRDWLSEKRNDVA
jgi:hypothetical protein